METSWMFPLPLYFLLAMPQQLPPCNLNTPREWTWLAWSSVWGDPWKECIIKYSCLGHHFNRVCGLGIELEVRPKNGQTRLKDNWLHPEIYRPSYNVMLSFFIHFAFLKRISESLLGLLAKIKCKKNQWKEIKGSGNNNEVLKFESWSWLCLINLT